MNTSQKSTYSLLVNSEEKNRSILETVLYLLWILSAVASIWQFAHQPIRLPATGLQSSAQEITVSQS